MAVHTQEKKNNVYLYHFIIIKEIYVVRFFTDKQVQCISQMSTTH